MQPLPRGGSRILTLGMEEQTNQGVELRGLEGFNAKADRRHDRRTMSVEELHKLIKVALTGRTIMGMTGEARALCYGLAALTGLRYAEIGSITPESFNWKAPNVVVQAAYTKNGETAVLPVPFDLVDALIAHVATVCAGKPVFPLPVEKGAKMLRYDLKRAGIPYQDASGQFFDFHSLRCQYATLLDAVGVSPRVVQTLMRHSSIDLTGRYTKPRTAHLDAAVEMLPSLKPIEALPQEAIMTGTDSTVTPAITDACNSKSAKTFTSLQARSAKPPSPVRIRAAPLDVGTRMEAGEYHSVCFSSTVRVIHTQPFNPTNALGCAHFRREAPPTRDENGSRLLPDDRNYRRQSGSPWNCGSRFLTPPRKIGRSQAAGPKGPRGISDESLDLKCLNGLDLRRVDGGRRTRLSTVRFSPLALAPRADDAERDADRTADGSLESSRNGKGQECPPRSLGTVRLSTVRITATSDWL